MAGDSVGKMFKVTVWGESHGPSIGAVIEGCPPGIELDLNEIGEELRRRKPGLSDFVSPRKEDDKFEIQSGLFNGRTTGTPLSLIIRNRASKSSNYEPLKNVYRPGHADFTYQAKYGIRDFYGGGRSSARLTAPIVAAGAVAKQVLRGEAGKEIEILAYVKRIGSIDCGISPSSVSSGHVSASIINFPNPLREQEVLALLEKLIEDGNSTGGIVECFVRNLPAGYGEPLFDKLDADLAKVMVGLNAAKGFEIGCGFKSAELTGRESNDEFIASEGRIRTATNRSGGVLGGISTGMPIVFRVAFKATPSISQRQNTIDMAGNSKKIQIVGEHDVCVAVRAVPVVEALAAIVILDHSLRFRGQCGSR